MISYLKGTVVSRDNESITLNVQGVGYEVYLTTHSLATCAPNSQRLRVFWIHTHQSQDSTRLFGFLSYPEKAYYALLLSVPNVGPKLALAIMSSMSPKDIHTCAQTKDSATLQSVPGIGRKKAEKLALELASKVEKVSSRLAFTSLAASPSEEPSSSQEHKREVIHLEDSANILDTSEFPSSQQNAVIGEVRSALKNLGYSASEIADSLHSCLLAEETIHDFEVLFKKCNEYLHSDITKRIR